MILTLVASGPNVVTTSTIVLLSIIKDDTTTPVFSRNIYYGTYLGPSQVNIDKIKLAQGFDSGVTFTLDGGKLTDKMIKTFHAVCIKIFNVSHNSKKNILQSMLITSELKKMKGTMSWSFLGRLSLKT